MRRIILMVIVASLVAGISFAEEKGKSKKSISQATATEKKFEGCRAKLKKAQKLDLLYNLDIKGGEIIVVVGPIFYNIPFDAKQNFADTINCFLMVGEDKYIDYDLLDYRTNKVVAEYHHGKLKMK